MSLIELRNATVAYPIHRPDSKKPIGEIDQPLGGTIFSDRRNDYVKALDRVDVTVRQGARIGLLGSNGSGKSTLLRALAGILPLATGERSIRGRVVTLFSTSCGIDPERTGEDNVKRMAALYNVPGRDVPSLIQAISEFTELGAFMKLPVKTYSNGMRARIGFAFITGIPADIVLIDEVIGAGDSGFYARARERLANFVQSSGAVVLASHSPAVLKSLCSHACIMRKGRIIRRGPIDEMIRYHDDQRQPRPSEAKSTETAKQTDNSTR